MADNFGKKIRFVEQDAIYILRLLLGFLLFVIGIIGLIFPVVPGWALIFVGLFLFDTDSKIRRKIISLIPEKYRQIARKAMFLGRKNARDGNK